MTPLQYKALTSLRESGGDVVQAARQLCQAAENDLALYQAITRPFLEGAAMMAVRQVDKAARPRKKKAASRGVEAATDPLTAALQGISKPTPMDAQEQARTLRHMAKAFMAQRYDSYARKDNGQD